MSALFALDGRPVTTPGAVGALVTCRDCDRPLRSRQARLATPSHLPRVRWFAAVFYGGLASACALVDWWPGVAVMAALWVFTVLCLRLVPVVVRHLARVLAQESAGCGEAR